MYKFSVYSLGMFLCLVKVGKMLKCLQCEGGECDIDEKDMNQCDSETGCFLSLFDNKPTQGCGASCPNDHTGCIPCRLIPLCNTKNDIKKETLLLTGVNKNDIIECYSCHGEDCKKSLSAMKICFSLKKCYSGLKSGEPFKSCWFSKPCLDGTGLNECHSCKENLCNNKNVAVVQSEIGTVKISTDKTINCYRCNGKMCLVKEEQMETCKATSSEGCYSNYEGDELQRGCSNFCPIPQKCKNCYHNLCNIVDMNAKINVTMKEHPKEEAKKEKATKEKEKQDNQIENKLLGSFDCFLCNERTCNVNDKIMQTCITTTTCFLKIVNFVEKRGCGNICGKNDTSNTSDGTKNVCVVCRRNKCNTNQENVGDHDSKENTADADVHATKIRQLHQKATPASGSTQYKNQTFLIIFAILFRKY